MVIGYFDADVRRIIFLLPDQRMTCLMPLTQHSHRFRWSLTILLILSLPAFAIAQEPTKKHNSLSVMDPATKRTLGKLTKVEQAILRYTNLARKQNGKLELTAVSHLNVAAQRHAINMARQQKMEHELDGKSATDRIKAVEYQFTAFGENIAAGYPNEKAAVAGWMNSPPHKGNILDEDKRGYVHIGIGAHKAANGVWYCCQVFARPASGNDYE